MTEILRRTHLLAHLCKCLILGSFFIRTPLSYGNLLFGWPCKYTDCAPELANERSRLGQECTKSPRLAGRPNRDRREFGAKS